MLNNQITIVGNLGKDAEIFFQDEKSIGVSFSLGQSYKEKDEEKTNWHDCKMFCTQKQLEHLKKGQSLIIQGKLTYNKYEDKENVKHKTAVILVNEFLTK